MALDTKPLNELKEQAGREKAAADPDRDAQERRHHRDRSVRTWTASDGSFQFRGNDTVASGGRLLEALNPIVDDIIEDRKKSDRPESRAAYLYDALVRPGEQARGTPSPDSDQTNGPRPTPKVRHRAILRLDLEALQRGRVEGDELCEIAGLGPIPIRTAMTLLGESTLHLVLTKGVDVAKVTHRSEPRRESSVREQRPTRAGDSSPAPADDPSCHPAIPATPTPKPEDPTRPERRIQVTASRARQGGPGSAEAARRRSRG